MPYSEVWVSSALSTYVGGLLVEPAVGGLLVEMAVGYGPLYRTLYL